ESARAAIVDGASLSTALRNEKLFPDLFLDMLAVGEQTGRLGETMHHIAEVYDRELNKQVELVSTLIPPLVMVVIAAVVGGVVYGLRRAVFAFAQTLRVQLLCLFPCSRASFHFHFWSFRRPPAWLRRRLPPRRRPPFPPPHCRRMFRPHRYRRRPCRRRRK